MIANNTISHEAVYIGDVQENRVGIDKANIDFITTLLTSNLYSKPFNSFLRETISNAYDSHVEAGTKDPILLLIEEYPNVEYTYKISIRDYGVGLSPERFDAIYKNIGSSTKRESNDYIGMFGIGRFSCLSCVDTAQITSFYNNVKYSYVMYKNGGGINIDKVSETIGDYKDGLEVSIIYKIDRLSEFQQAISELSMFENLHIHFGNGDSYYSRRIKDILDKFNERQITHYNNFSICNFTRSINYYKIGNVLYPVDSSKIDHDLFKAIYDPGIIIHIPMGSVNITPNRESLQYSSHTLSTLKTCLDNAKKEIEELISSKYSHDYTLSTFCEDVVSYPFYTINNIPPVNFEKEYFNLNENKVTINKKAIPKSFVTFIDIISSLYIDNRFIYKILNAHRLGAVSLSKVFSGKVKLLIKGDSVTKAVTLNYIKSKYSVPILIFSSKLAFDEFFDDINKYANHYSYRFKDNNIAELLNFFKENFNVETLSNDAIPNDYVEKYKEEQREKRNSNNKMYETPIRIYFSLGYKMSEFKNLPNKGLILYTAHTKEDEEIKKVSCITILPQFSAVITVKSSVISNLKNNKRFIPLEKVLFLQNPILTKFATAYLIKKQFYKDLNGILAEPFRLPIYLKFHEKYKDYAKNINNYTNYDILNKYIKNNWYNQEEVNKYRLTEEEIAALKFKKLAFTKKKQIIDSYIYKKIGKFERVGISLNINQYYKNLKNLND